MDDLKWVSIHRQACVVSEDSQLKNVHLRDADKETCLLPREEGDPGRAVFFPVKVMLSLLQLN